MEIDIVDRIDQSFDWAVLVHTYGVAFPFALLAIVHLIVVGATWYGIMAVIIFGVNFIVDFVPALLGVINREDSIF